MLYIGVDGGGSTCRVRIRDREGRIVGSATGGAANVYLDFDAALGTIAATVAAALDPARLHGGTTPIRLGLGLAGLSNADVADRVRRALAGFGTVMATHDGETACLGAHAGRDGALIIAGTGSGAVIRTRGVSTALGGRGFILGDDGSGARLGLDALREALRAHDSLAAHGPLTRRLMAHFADDPVAAIAWGRTARSLDFAAFAPWVFAAATSGDATALALVRAAADAIALLAEATRHRGATRLSFVGGLSEALRPYLPDALRQSLHPPLFDALDGALLLAGCPGEALAAFPAP